MSDVAYDPNGSFNAGYGRVSQALTDIGRSRAGNALAGGRSADAANALYRSGDLAGGRQIQQDQAAQDDAKKARELASTMQIVRALRSARDQGQDVTAALDSYRPVIAQLGVDEAAFGQIRNLLSTDATALDKIEQLVGQQAQELEFRNAGQDILVLNKGTGEEVRRYRQAPQDYTLGDARFSGETNQPVAQAPREAEYIQRDPTRDLVEIPGAPAQGLGGGGGGSAPRGIRNNNPGNIEDGAFARSLPGYVGSDGRFAIFDSPEAGSQAAPRLLQSYISRGFDTPAEIINRWAPPSDNNPTQAYAAYVAQRLGISPTDRVRPEQVPMLAQAISEFENGQRVRGPSAAAPASGPRVVAPASAPASAGGTILTPQEVAAAGLAPGTVAQRSSTGQISILQAAPGQGSRGNPTEAQNKDSFNANRMSGAGSIVGRLESSGFDFGRAQAGGQLTDNYRRYEAAMREWADSLLRMTTGAAATADEIANARQTYFPVIGDSPAVRQQKAARRAQVEQDALLRGAGGRSDRAAGGAPSERPRPQTNAPGVPFNLSPTQLRYRQQLIASGADPSAPLGNARNPYYTNPEDERSSLSNYQGRADETGREFVVITNRGPALIRPRRNR